MYKVPPPFTNINQVEEHTQQNSLVILGAKLVHKNGSHANVLQDNSISPIGPVLGGVDG